MASPSVDRVLGEALRGPREGWIDATSVYRFALSPFAVWCDRFAPDEAKDPVDDFQKLLLEQGRAHEERVLRARWPEATALSFATPEEGFAAVLEAMARGVPAIHGGPLFWLPDGLVGRFDVLERRDDAPSVFGRHHYVVREIKLAKQLQDHHRLQGAFYNRILGKIQGYTPATFALVDRDHEETTFAYDEPELLAVLAGIRAIHRGERPPAVYGAGAPPWQSYTDRVAKEERDVSLVAGVGPARRARIAELGLRTVDALAQADPSRLAALRGIGEKSARDLHTRARAIVQGAHIRTGRVSFPEARTEVFLDLEGTGAQQAGEGLVEMDYLIGALVRTEGKEEYKAFVAHGLDEEGAMFRAFVDWLEGIGEAPLYHWHHYEVTHLRKLAQRHGLRPQMHARLFGGLRDLYKDATGAFAFPTHDHSIKSIAPYLGFHWRHKDVGAMASIALYFDYVKDPKANGAKLQKVLDYNEDDCIAMRVVKDWLVTASTP